MRVKPLEHFSLLKYYTLLTKAASEEEVDMPGILPEGYFTQPDDRCQVGEWNRGDG